MMLPKEARGMELSKSSSLPPCHHLFKHIFLSCLFTELGDFLSHVLSSEPHQMLISSSDIQLGSIDGLPSRNSVDVMETYHIHNDSKLDLKG